MWTVPGFLGFGREDGALGLRRASVRPQTYGVPQTRRNQKVRQPAAWPRHRAFRLHSAKVMNESKERMPHTVVTSTALDIMAASGNKAMMSNARFSDS